MIGFDVGNGVGLLVGEGDGKLVGFFVVGEIVGCDVSVGFLDGLVVGLFDGGGVESVGDLDGFVVGHDVGLGVGAFVFQQLSLVEMELDVSVVEVPTSLQLTVTESNACDPVLNQTLLGYPPGAFITASPKYPPPDVSMIHGATSGPL